MAETMWAAVYYRNDDVRIEEVAKPRAGAGELLVETRASGICGSDVMEWYRVGSAPRVLGHEVTGVVAEVGEGVEGFRPGERVCVTHHVPCNRCALCLRGDHTACEMLKHTNFDPGGFAEFIRLPAVNVERGTLRLPDAVSDDAGVFIEPLGCVLRGWRRFRMTPGLSVLVVGSGASGLLHVQAARLLGAGAIFATDISPYRLEAAGRFGAHALPPCEDMAEASTGGEQRPPGGPRRPVRGRTQGLGDGPRLRRDLRRLAAFRSHAAGDIAPKSTSTGSGASRSPSPPHTARLRSIWKKRSRSSAPDGSKSRR